MPASALTHNRCGASSPPITRKLDLYQSGTDAGGLAWSLPPRPCGAATPKMNMKTKLPLALFSLAGLLVGAPTASAHCDTLSGPVIVDARQALENKDVTPVLKWIRSADEAEIRSAFDRALKVRGTSADAASLADEFFYATLVRVHRAGEGAPFTGLKSTPPAPVEQASDHALESGEIAPLADELAAGLKQQITQKFAATRGLRAHAGHNVEAGRAYVAAYVDYVHFVDAVARLAEPTPAESHTEHAH